MQTYDYGTSEGVNDKLSRVEKLGFWEELELTYSYLWLDTFVTSDMNIGYAWNLATGDSFNPYASLDRFGRVIRNYWYNTSGPTALDDIRYSYDRASNRTTRENIVAKAQTTPQY